MLYNNAVFRLSQLRKIELIISLLVFRFDCNKFLQFTLNS